MLNRLVAAFVVAKYALVYIILTVKSEWNIIL
jgi:hypothetical protein